jgi:cell division septal protein FtsQ
MVSKQSASRAKQNNAKKSPAKQPQQKKTTAKHPFIAALSKIIIIGLLIIVIPWVGIPLTLSVIFNITEQSQALKSSCVHLAVY